MKLEVFSCFCFKPTNKTTKNYKTYLLHIYLYIQIYIHTLSDSIYTFFFIRYFVDFVFFLYSSFGTSFQVTALQISNHRHMLRMPLNLFKLKALKHKWQKWVFGCSLGRPQYVVFIPFSVFIYHVGSPFCVFCFSFSPCFLLLYSYFFIIICCMHKTKKETK